MNRILSYFFLMTLILITHVALAEILTEKGSVVLSILQSSAKEGDARSQNMLGKLYASGEMVQQNDAKAVKYFQAAAAQHDAEAQFNLGKMYALGKGIRQNHEEAAKLFLMAAKQGNSEGQLNSGISYYLGYGVPENHTEAFKWIRLAAEGQNSDAMVLLAVWPWPEDVQEATRILPIEWLMESCRLKNKKGCQLYREANSALNQKK